eukprot:tig00021116_g18415.t1
MNPRDESRYEEDQEYTRACTWSAHQDAFPLDIDATWLQEPGPAAAAAAAASEPVQHAQELARAIFSRDMDALLDPIFDFNAPEPPDDRYD